MNSKFWIFTLAALGLAGSTKALAQTGSGEHSDAVTTADDQFLKNGGKKVELVEGTRAEQMVEERSSEFAVELVENTVAENMAKNQTTEDLVEERSSEFAEQMVEGICLEQMRVPELMAQPTDSILHDSIPMDNVHELSASPIDNVNQKVNAPADVDVLAETLFKNNKIGVLHFGMDVLLDAEKFVKAVQSPGPNTDVDAIMRLNPEEQQKYITEAETRPLRIEVDTVIVHNINKFELNGKISHDVQGGMMIGGLNMIKLHYFVLSDKAAAKSNTNLRRFIDVLNRQIKFVLVHEGTHYGDIQCDVSALDYNQTMQDVLQYEIISRLNERLLGRAILVETGDMDEAFPIQMHYIREKHVGNDFDKKFKFGNKKNPIRALNPVGTADAPAVLAVSFKPDPRLPAEDYMSYLFGHPEINPDEISTEEWDALWKSIMRDVNGEFVEYVENGQFMQMVKSWTGRANGALRGHLRDMKKAGQEKLEAKDFDEIVYDRFTVPIGSNDVFVLEAISPEMNQGFMQIIMMMLNNTQLKKDFEVLKNQIGPTLKYNGQVREMVFGERPPQVWDVCGALNKGLRKKSLDMMRSILQKKK